MADESEDELIDLLPFSMESNHSLGHDEVDDLHDMNETNEDSNIIPIFQPSLFQDSSGNANDSDHESGGEDLFGDDMEQDYRSLDEQDRYDSDMIDDSEVSELSINTRRCVERNMHGTDSLGKHRRLDPFYGTHDSDDDFPKRKTKPRRKFQDIKTAKQPKDNEFEPLEFLEDTRGMSIKEWVMMPGTKENILDRFKVFLYSFELPSGFFVYREKIKKMCEDNKMSIEVCYYHLASADQTLAYFLPEAPTQMLALMNDSLSALVFQMFNQYRRVSSFIFTRIINLPLTDDIRSLRCFHMNQLVRFNGVVTTSTSVVPQIFIAFYKCIGCGANVGPLTQSNILPNHPNRCAECQGSGPFALNEEKTIFQDYQRHVIQEIPGQVPAGRLPRSKNLVCLNDMANQCVPGDEVDVTGIFTTVFDGSLNVKLSFPVFATIILANHIVKKNNKSLETTMCKTDIEQILELSKDERIFDRMAASIAPSIYGHDNIKRAITLSLFGGVRKNPAKKHQLRGDINVLLCGDPGTSKSQFLKCAQKLAPRSIYATGHGATAVGLTACVQRSPLTNEWTLEAGALVLSDEGVCLIDEFDKMGESDRVSIHEAMEQQSISISKAGIVATLQARCAIIAAANPRNGNYDTSLTFLENVDLTEPILSRFDILCVVKDIADPHIDELLAKFVIGSHIRHHPQFDQLGDVYEEDVLSQPMTPNNQPSLEEYDDDGEIMEFGELNVPKIPKHLLKKYLIYARQHCSPKVDSGINDDRLARLYSNLRKESMATGCFPITVRHIESMIRISEAHAKIHLREYVNEDDINMSIRIVLESFIDTQKSSIRNIMRKEFQRYLVYKRDTFQLLLFVIKKLVNEQRVYFINKYRRQPAYVEIFEKDFMIAAKELKIDQVSSFYESKVFLNNNLSYNKIRKIIRIEYER